MGSAGRRLNRQLTGGWRVLLLALYGLNGPNGLNPKCGVRCWVQRSSWNLFGCQLTGPVWTMEMTVLEQEPWQRCCALFTFLKDLFARWTHLKRLFVLIGRYVIFVPCCRPFLKWLVMPKYMSFFVGGGTAWPVESAECARWTLTAPRGGWTLQKPCRGTEKRWFLPLCIGVIRSIRM